MGAVCAVLFLALCVWAAVSPRSMWWTTTAWRYRDPASNEPSDAAYLMTRLGGIVVVAVVAVAAVVTVTRPDSGGSRSDRPRATPTARAADTGPLLRALGGNHPSVRVEARELRPYWSLRAAGGRVVPMLGYMWIRQNRPKALWAAAGSVDLSVADLAVVVPGECPVDVFVSEGTGGGVTGVTVALVVGAAPELPDPPPPGVPTPSTPSSAPSGTGPGAGGVGAPGAAPGGGGVGAPGASPGAAPGGGGVASPGGGGVASPGGGGVASPGAVPGGGAAPGAGASPSVGCNGEPGSLVVLALDLVTSSTRDREVWDEAIGTPTKELPVS